jgi:hypothetical protein
MKQLNEYFQKWQLKSNLMWFKIRNLKNYKVCQKWNWYWIKSSEFVSNSQLKGMNGFRVFDAYQLLKFQ